MADHKRAFAQNGLLEGGWSDHPDDPGGKTFCGICEAQYPGLPEKLRDMPRSEALKIVEEVKKRDYWDVLNLDLVEDEDVAFEVFDTGILCGQPTAAIMVQKLCGAAGIPLNIDGRMGLQTVSALNRLARENKQRVLVVLNCLQGARHVELCIQEDPVRAERARTFFRGWIDKRVQLKPVLLSEST